MKEARLRAGMSQEQLGIQAGLEEASASARMNRYERGTRIPTVELVNRIAGVLHLPSTYFYAEDDLEASMLIAWYKLPLEAKQALLKTMQCSGAISTHALHTT